MRSSSEFLPFTILELYRRNAHRYRLVHRVYVFFSWQRANFVFLTRKNIVVIFHSDIRRHTGTFRGKLQIASIPRVLSLKVLFPLREIIRFSLSVVPLGRSCGLNIVGSAPFYYLFYPTQGFDNVFSVEMLRT